MQGTAAGEEAHRASARRSDRRALRIGLTLSAVVHAALLAAVVFPRPDLIVVGADDWGLRGVYVPPRVDVPPSPRPVRRPSPPQVSAVHVTEAAASSAEADRVSIVVPAPEPPAVSSPSEDDRPAVAPPEVAPSLEAPEHFRRRLQRRYPRLLRDRGVGGVVELEFFVSPRGDVSGVRVAESSGHRSLDRVASRLAGEMQFMPALNRDRAVGVWVSQRICFVTLEGVREEPGFAECEHRVALGGR